MHGDHVEMAGLLIVARLSVAAALLLAGALKLWRPADAARQLVGLGTSAAWAVPLTRALAVLELCVGGALLWRATAWAGAAAALGLLLVFTGLAIRDLLAGSRADCGCFGGGREHTPIPRLFRNQVLAALAGFAVLAGRHDAGPDAWTWLGQVPLGGLTLLGLTAATAAGWRVVTR